MAEDKIEAVKWYRKAAEQNDAKANPWANSCAAKAFIRPIWPASARQVKEGALQRLSAKPGRQQGQVSTAAYEALKHELQEKERTLADLSVELAILRKKTTGGSWAR